MEKKSMLNLNDGYIPTNEKEQYRQRLLYLKSFIRDVRYNDGGIEKIGKQYGPSEGYPSVVHPWVNQFDDSHLHGYINDNTVYEEIMKKMSEKNPDEVVMIYDTLDVVNSPKEARFQIPITAGQFVVGVEAFSKVIEQNLEEQKGKTENNNDVIMLSLPTSPEGTYSILACSNRRVRGVQHDLTSDIDSFEYRIKMEKPSLLITLDDIAYQYRDVIEKYHINTICIKTNPFYKKPMREYFENSNNIKWMENEITRCQNHELIDKKGDKNDPIITDYTSGSTGKIPKAINLANRSLNSFKDKFLEVYGDELKEGSVTFILMPPFVGFGSSILLSTLNSDSIAVLFPTYNPEIMPKQVLRYIKDYDVNIAGSPAHVEALSRDKEINSSNAQLFGHKIGLCLEGGNIISQSSINKINFTLEKYGTKLRHSYGATEHTSGITSPFDTPYDSNQRPLFVPDSDLPIVSSGSTFTNVDVMVVDDNDNELPFSDYVLLDEDNNQILDPNSNKKVSRIVRVTPVGNLCVKSDSEMLSYSGAETKYVTSKSGEKYLYIGDKSVLSEDGLVYIVGRREDLAIGYNGQKTNLSNLDEKCKSIIPKFPFIKEVLTFKIDDPNEHISGEIPVVAVAIDDNYTGEINLEAYINELSKCVIDYSLPKRVYVVDQIPKTKTSKPTRQPLEEAAKNGELIPQYCLDNYNVEEFINKIK